MKRLLISVSVLLILCVGCMVTAAALIVPTGDDVVFTPTVLYGDAAAAEGLTVCQYSDLNNILYWDSVYTIGDPDTCITKHEIDLERKYPSQSEFTPRFELSLHYDFDFNYVDKTETAGGLLTGWYEFSKTVPAGTDREKQVLLSEFVDYYPISGSVRVGSYATDTWNYYSENLIDEHYTGSVPLTGDVRETALAFNSYFRIPVLPGENLALWCVKGRDGAVSGTGIYAVGEDNFYLQTYPAFTDDAIFFTFNTHTPGGRVVDTSLIPGGYGIYCLPCHADQDRNFSLDPENLATVYSLDSDMDVLDLHLSHDEKKLLLHANENGAYTITVIDIATMTQLQHITVAEYEQPIVTLHSTEGEDYYILVPNYANFVVLALNESGEYEVRINAPIAGDEEPASLFFNNRSIAMDYDGEKLAVVYGSTEQTDDDYVTVQTCGFTVSVYGSDGLAYFASYDSSLDSAETVFYTYKQCAPDWKRDFISAQWND